MSTPLKLVTATDKQKQGVLDALAKLTEEITGGHVIAFTAVVEHDDYTYHITGSGSPSRTQTAGALLDAAIDRLGYKDE